MLETVFTGPFKRRALVSLVFLRIAAMAQVPSVAQAPGADAVERVETHGARADAFSRFPLGAVTPRGWIRDQLEQNLAGFTGHLDQLAPDLILKDDIYGRDRLSPSVRRKDVGAQGVPEADQAQFLWWNSETQSNWWDGYLRTAVLLDRSDAIDRARGQVMAILSKQDPDGYLGIYTPDMRYRFNDENGELWSKATLLRYVLGWYEYSQDQRVLVAAKRAIANLMANWPVDRSHPFHSVRARTSGLSHGLAITDVLEELYGLTGDRAYVDYALFCYRDFSDQHLEEDAQFTRLLDKAQPLRGHGVHTYEHLRSVAAAYGASGSPRLREALENFIVKIDACTTVTGGPVGDEFIGGVGASETTRGYEYCSLHESLHSYVTLLAKLGDSRFGERAERLFFNAAQGARLPLGAGVAYLKSDNSYQMTGPLNSEPPGPGQIRYKYSPVHQDVAVCCVPNAGRIAPYFVQSMWLSEPGGVVAALLGPCALSTVVEGKPLTIVEETDYPYGNVLRFKVNRPSGRLTLKIRKPAWALAVEASRDVTERDGFLLVAIEPSLGTQDVVVAFKTRAEAHPSGRGETYFSWGALILAHPLAATETIGRTYPLPGFKDTLFRAAHPIIYRSTGADPTEVGQGRIKATASLLNPSTRASETVDLVPMGETILRQVTFPSPN